MTESSVWLIEWRDELSVGTPEVDEDHKHFIALVNDLNRAILDRKVLSEIRKCMQALLADADQHFAREEIFLKQWNYPDADKHALKHAQISKKLHATMDTLSTHNTDVEWITAALEIKEALTDHLLIEDAKTRDFRISNG